jgi:ParB family chromosome partitioning protein
MPQSLPVLDVPIPAVSLPANPDRLFPDELGIDELAASIATHGLLQPIIVAALPDNTSYLLIAGQRRLLACKQLAWPTIPAHVLELKTTSPEALRLTENVQRLDLSPIEEGIAIKRWREIEHLTQEEAADRLHLGISWLKKREALPRLPDELITALHLGTVSPSVALELARIDDAEVRNYYLEVAIQHGATQDVAATWVANFKAQGASPSAATTAEAAEAFSRNPGGHKLACHACDRTILISSMRTALLCPECFQALDGATAKVQEP